MDDVNYDCLSIWKNFIMWFCLIVKGVFEDGEWMFIVGIRIWGL